MGRNGALVKGDKAAPIDRHALHCKRLEEVGADLDVAGVECDPACGNDFHRSTRSLDTYLKVNPG